MCGSSVSLTSLQDYNEILFNFGVYNTVGRMAVYCFFWVYTNLCGEFRCGCKITLLVGFNLISGSIQFSVDQEYYYSCTYVWEQVAVVATTITSTTTTNTITTTTTTNTSNTTTTTINVSSNSRATNISTINLLHLSLLNVVQTYFSGSICVRCNIDDYPVKSFTYRTEHVKAYDIHRSIVYSEDSRNIFPYTLNITLKYTGCFLRKHRPFVTKHYHCKP